jgi:hypothetical protein
VNVKYMFFKRKNNKNTLNYISDELVSNPWKFFKLQASTWLWQVNH